MFLLLFALLIIAILVGTCADIAMKVELSRQEVTGEKLSWWSYRGGDQVPERYKQLYPDSSLPLLRDIPFYLVIGCAAAALIVALWKSRH